MKAVFWLVPDAIAGRPGPQMEPWSVAAIRAAGFDAVINLSEYPPDFEALAAAGIEACWVPLPTDIPPTRESAERCVEALPRAYAELNAHVAARRRVLVHCFAGKDRTGMLLTLFLAKRDSLSAAEALRKVREVRPLAITAPGWEELALSTIPKVIEKMS